MKFPKLLFCCLILLTLSSCHMASSTIGNYNLPTTVEKNPSKKGESCAHFVFPFFLIFSNYDLTVENARQSADIKNIISVESHIRKFPFYSYQCVVVRGN